MFDFERQLPDELKILDVGCGNGRFLKFLAKNSKFKGEYTGIDFSEELLRKAKSNLKSIKNFRIQLKETDILASNLPGAKGQYNLIALFGLMHHIPSYEKRGELLEKAFNYLEGNGVMIFTLWQFMNSDRLASKVMIKEEMTALLGRIQEDLEEGDYLLDWDNSGIPRYCHYFHNNEIKRVIGDIEKFGGKIIDSFSADGKEGNLNRYILVGK